MGLSSWQSQQLPCLRPSEWLPACLALAPRPCGPVSRLPLLRPGLAPAAPPAHLLHPQASGAGDGVVRLWGVVDAKGGSSKALEPLGGIPARGFVNSLAFARSGRFLAAGLGQEPRMGRWLRDGVARNGVLIQPLQLQDEGGN